MQYISKISPFIVHLNINPLRLGVDTCQGGRDIAVTFSPAGGKQ